MGEDKEKENRNIKMEMYMKEIGLTIREKAKEK